MVVRRMLFCAFLTAPTDFISVFQPISHYMSYNTSHRLTVLFTLVLFSLSTVAAKPATPVTPGPDSPSVDPGPENKTRGGVLTSIPGLKNETLPMTLRPPELPDLPKQASGIAENVTSSISKSFDSAVNGFGRQLGSLLQNTFQGEQPDRNRTSVEG